jgi:hypothetical protein
MPRAQNGRQRQNATCQEEWSHKQMPITPKERGQLSSPTNTSFHGLVNQRAINGGLRRIQELPVRLTLSIRRAGPLCQTNNKAQTGVA